MAVINGRSWGGPGRSQTPQHQPHGNAPAPARKAPQQRYQLVHPHGSQHGGGSGGTGQSGGRAQTHQPSASGQGGGQGSGRSNRNDGPVIFPDSNQGAGQGGGQRQPSGASQNHGGSGGVGNGGGVAHQNQGAPSRALAQETAQGSSQRRPAASRPQSKPQGQSEGDWQRRLSQEGHPAYANQGGVWSGSFDALFGVNDETSSGA